MKFSPLTNRTASKGISPCFLERFTSWNLSVKLKSEMSSRAEHDGF